MVSFPLLLALGLLAYAAGSIPLHRFLGLADFDAKQGVKPFLRSLGRFALNVGKGVVIVEVGCLYDPMVALATAVGVSYGHNFPIWSTFNGGTGLGVIVGALVAIDPTLGLFSVVAWLTTFYVFHNQTLAAVTAALVTPFIASFLGMPFSAFALLPLTVLVLLRHKEEVRVALMPQPAETEDVFRGL